MVLAEGAVWNGLRAVQKDNAGYQLRRLFCGSEGTLGVVTRAVLKLVAVPRHRATALLTMTDLAATVRFGTLLRSEAAELLQAVEFISDIGISLALRHIKGLSFPLATRSDSYLLLDLAATSSVIPLDDILSKLLERGIEEGLVLDGSIVASESQRAAFWRLREEGAGRLMRTRLCYDRALCLIRRRDRATRRERRCGTA